MEHWFTEQAVCQEFDLQPETLSQWQEAGLIDSKEGKYSSQQVRRIWSIVSLHRDLDVNLAGVQIILDLAGQLQQLQTTLAQASAEIRQLRRDRQFHLRIIEERFGPIEWQVDL